MPYEGSKDAKDLSDQEVKRVVLKALRREKAWSQSYANPTNVKTIACSSKHVSPTQIKAITSDLAVTVNGSKLALLHVDGSDLTSIHVYEFPPTQSWFGGEYDHREQKFYVISGAYSIK